MLNANPDLEASALRALDLLDDARIPALFHVDDPAFPASSAGELQRTLNLVATWCADHGAEFHVTQHKTVVFRTGGQDALPPLCFPNLVTAQNTTIVQGKTKKWLGWMWDANGGADATLRKRMVSACGAFALLRNFVVAGAIPLPLAIPLFHSKVDGSLAFGRGIFCVAPGTLAELDNLESRWARDLLGAPAWASAAVCRLELGFILSGSAKAVLDIARRRDKLWMRPINEFYRTHFMKAQEHGGST